MIFSFTIIVTPFSLSRFSLLFFDWSAIPIPTGVGVPQAVDGVESVHPVQDAVRVGRGTGRSLAGAGEENPLFLTPSTVLFVVVLQVEG